METSKKSHKKKDKSFKDVFFGKLKITDAERKSYIKDNATARYISGAGDVGYIPPCKNQARRDACEFNFKLYCETYFPDEFALGWSDDHLIVIEKMELVVLKDELFALAMPRGSGKTTLSEKASCWAISYAHKKFMVMIGSDKGASVRAIDTIKVAFETNELLAEDFPEICIPVQKLEGLAQRAHSQSHNGNPTRIRWSVDKLVFPTIEGSKSSGTVVQGFGLTGGIRGVKHALADGTTIRPDLAIVDDPQTDVTAFSQTQNDQRERLLVGAVLKLSGPDKKLALIMPCTVIAKNDLADRILDRTRNPRFQGHRMKMIYEFPKNMKLWDEYKTIWQEGLVNEDGGQAGRDFYIANREEMDRGAVVAWEDRIEGSDISALHSSMSFFLENEHAFQSEYQNEPIDENDDPENQLHTEDLENRCNGIDKGIVPIQYGRLVCFIDVGSATGITYVVMAIGENFSGAVVDYGTIEVKTGKTFDEQENVWLGMEQAVERVTKAYRIDSGEEIYVSNIAVDSGWNTDLVYRFCRESIHSGILIPTKGAYVKPAQRLYASKSKGAIKGTEWIYAHVQNSARQIRLLRYNVNYWKTFCFERFRAGVGASGAVGVFGKRNNHKRFFDHMTSEYRVKMLVENKSYDVWEVKPNRENHLWDCAVGCCVLGDYLGISIFGASERSNGMRKRKVVRLPSA